MDAQIAGIGREPALDLLDLIRDGKIRHLKILY